MILKTIRLTASPGRLQELSDRQRIWNDAMMSQPGFVGVQLALDPKATDQLLVLITIETQEALDLFMAGDHDDLEQRTKIRDVYETCEVQVFDLLD